ncbi:MAG TPA: hypothetical protein PLZ75_02650 [Bacteroidales bacterium]|jgi:hypothetical protein|nr:hypothetical protein [Bacteroidales bacterium]HQH22777.1 hypothetical protein [Bacteroidales bacterium]HQJ81757.1 hypothetical protein [Bacteroidales bacterium]
MRRTICLSFIAIALLLTACSKEKESERFRLLTTPVWVSESILVNGVKPEGDWDFLNDFTGDAKFHKDGTGYFGSFTGEWKFNDAETEIIITTTTVPIPIVTEIIELTSVTLKISTTILNPQNPAESADVIMIFKAR